MTMMNISDYAKHADVNRKTITRWIKAGKYIVMAGMKSTWRPATRI